MRSTTLALTSLLAFSSFAQADLSAVNVLWTNDFNTDPGKPIMDDSMVALATGYVLQIGFFEGVDPNKDPGTYTPADWGKFIALTGDGSSNATALPTFVGDGGAPDGYFSIGVTFDTEIHNDIPLIPVRIGLRVFNASTVAAATFQNTVSVNSSTWILPAPVVSNPMNPNPPFPAEANMDFADDPDNNLGIDWEGTPWKTDVVPGMTAPTLVLTDVSQTGPTSLQISWSGGDGTNNIETSTNGTSWTNVSTGVASPSTITIDPVGTTALLVRVVEP